MDSKPRLCSHESVSSSLRTPERDSGDNQGFGAYGDVRDSGCSVQLHPASAFAFWLLSWLAIKWIWKVFKLAWAPNAELMSSDLADTTKSTARYESKESR